MYFLEDERRIKVSLKCILQGQVKITPNDFGLGTENVLLCLDANDAILSGWYRTDSGTVNLPSNLSTSGVLLVSRRQDKRIFQ